MPTTTFLFSAAGQASWIADRSCILTAVAVIGASSKAAILSYDPSATVAAFTAPGSNSVDRNVISVATGTFPPTPIGIPVSAGESILVSISGAGSVVVFWDSA